MVIRLATLKSLLWFIAILLMVLSFPLQVYAKNPYPSLLPYAVFGVIVTLNSFFPRRTLPPAVTQAPRHSSIDQMVSAYVFLVLLNTGWQAALGVISFSETGNALVVYLLPVVFYQYFRRAASENEIRAVLVAMVVAGFVVGAYFAYDSFLKLALHQVSDYSKMAFQYSLDRANQTADQANVVRITAGYRSLGLLETHSVSGAWVILGALAALALIPPNPRILRRATVLIFAMMLLLGLNFTTIITYGIIVILFEFGASAVFRGRISATVWRDLASLAVVVALTVVVALWIAGDVMSKFMGKNLFGQLELLLGTTTSQQGMPSKYLTHIAAYFQHIADFPITLLIGDGFSSYGETKGGDIGYLDTVTRFGLPFFVACVYGLLVVVKGGIHQARLSATNLRSVEVDSYLSRIPQFAVCVMLMILITDGHYSVWGTKSILPIICFSLALLNRYRTIGRRGRLPVFASPEPPIQTSSVPSVHS